MFNKIPMESEWTPLKGEFSGNLSGKFLDATTYVVRGIIRGPLTSFTLDVPAIADRAIMADGFYSGLTAAVAGAVVASYVDGASGNRIKIPDLPTDKDWAMLDLIIPLKPR